MKINKLIISSSFLLAACAVTGCSTSMLNSDEFRMSGTPDGIRAFSETLEGVGIIAKTAPESLPKNPHSALRMAQEEQKTLRIKLMSMREGGE